MLISSLKPGEVNESGVDCDMKSVDSDSDDYEESSLDDERNQEIMSAAALCIKVGSFTDPREAEGLAHFLEHMVFMGSSKYPKENDFDSYISNRGGSSNAWTCNECTLFHFDVKRNYFYNSLDRFAHFFISPLLLQTSVDQELSAVHSEYELGYTKDSVRVGHLISSLAIQGSPYRRFTTGNTKSLRDIPSENGVDVYKLLREFRSKYYSASYMTLAIQSKDTLDNLERMARQIFSSVPNNGGPVPDWSKALSFDVQSFAKLYRVCPVHSKEDLEFHWVLPSQVNDYETCSVYVISSLIGHEGHGSILALLKELNLATALRAGVGVTSDFENSSICCIFETSITLTDMGRNDIFKVCQIVFDYIKMLLESAVGHPYGNGCSPSNRSVHTFRSYLSEYQIIKQTAFDYEEPEDPEDTVCTVANMMQLYPPELVYSACSVVRTIDLDKCIELLRLMTPNRAAIIFLSSSFAKTVSADIQLEREPWYNISYQVETIPDDVMASWINSQPMPELHMPFVNKFITTDFECLNADDDMQIPVDLNLESGRQEQLRFGHLWFQQSTKFKCPKVYVNIHLWSDIVSKSCENLVLANIMINGIQQSLDTITYEAGEANLNQSVSFSYGGMCICMDGFNEKLFHLYMTVVDHLKSWFNATVTDDSFKSWKEVIHKHFYNMTMKPSSLCKSVVENVLLKHNFPLIHLLAVLPKLNVNHFLAFRQNFIAALHFTIYAFGNLSKSTAIDYFDYIVEHTGCQAISKRLLSPTVCIKPGTMHQIRVMNSNPMDVNTSISQLHLIGRVDLERDCYNRLLAFILSEPAFDYLRTKETLGYSVSINRWHSFHRGDSECGIMISVDSQINNFSVNHVTAVISTFWRRIAPRILGSMSDENYKIAVNGFISSLQLADLYMYSEFSRNWTVIIKNISCFDYREQLIKHAQQITQRDLFSFLIANYFCPSKQRSIMVQVDANESAKHMSTELDVDSANAAKTPMMMDSIKFEIVRLDNAKIETELSQFSRTKLCPSNFATDYDDQTVDEFDRQIQSKMSPIINLTFFEKLDCLENCPSERLFINSLDEFRETSTFRPSYEI